MMKALAPRFRWGCLWVGLSIIIVGGAPATVLAQKPEGKGAAEPKKTEKPPAKADEKKPDEAKPEVVESRGASFEVFKDPRAEAALKIFKSVPGLKPAAPRLIASMRTMSAGGPVNREEIQSFVQGMASDLVDKGNINRLINPPPGQNPNAPSVRAIQAATDNLLDALNTAKLAKNQAFLNVYTQELLATLPKLLDNNLVARVQAMIVLGQTNNPAALPVFLDQIKNQEQTLWVKLWALNGLISLVDNGTRIDTAVNAQDAINAGKVVSDFLTTEADLPWYIQKKALEALGSMRQSAVPNSLQKVEMAASAMRLLADPSARPEVRAAAAWALGMERVNPAVNKYNYALVAYYAGLLAADLGTRVNAGRTKGTDDTAGPNYLTSLLVAPINQAFNGLEGARESGLLKVPGGNPNAAFVKQTSDLITNVARASVELVKAPNGQIPARNKDLADRVAALKQFLDKNAPKDFHLVPSGDEYRPAVEKVVEKKPVDGKPSSLAGPKGG